MASRKKTAMSDTHKASLALGRSESAAVRRYLESLEASKPSRGRRRTTDSVEKRLAAIESELASANALSRLRLLQERRNLQATLDRSGEPVLDLESLEAEFVKVARSYGERKGIDYSSWRAIGVQAPVLRAAGIGRSKKQAGS